MFLIIFTITLNVLIFIFNEKIARFLNLYDSPDSLRKLHKTRVPLTGGIIILLNSTVAIIFSLINKFYYEDYIIFKNNLDLIILYFSIFIFFFVGFIDDKYNISPNKRFFFITLILFPIVYFSDDLIINKITFSFVNYNFTIPYIYSMVWTVLCFLLFINSMNMFDGINYQVGLYSIYLSLFFLINNYFILFFLFIIIGLLAFLVLNHKYKSFLGDSGSYVLAFIFSYFFIKIYNQTEHIKVDHIFLFMIIPGIDLIRLFLVRISKSQNPFKPDRNHLHHIISKKFNLINTNLIIQCIIIIPSLSGYYFGFTYVFLLIQMIFYFYFILSK